MSPKGDLRSEILNYVVTALMGLITVVAGFGVNLISQINEKLGLALITQANHSARIDRLEVDVTELKGRDR